MSIINQKKDIFGDISAIKALLEGFPKLQANPSFPSINNDTNVLNFLTDLLSSLVGIESLKDVIIDTLANNLDNIEDDIKKVLKTELNKIISCGINPSIPQSILHPNYNPNSTGVDLEISKIDFNNLFLMDPNSPSGELLFSDFESGTNSTDFNSFLFSVLQSNSTHGWGATTLGNNILDFKFKELGIVNNVLNVKVSEKYSNPANGLKLKDLNNDYIDSIDLLDMREILNKIVDNVFGTISRDQNRSKDQLLQEAKINSIIDRIINQEDEEEIDNSYFEFDNDDLVDLELEVDQKKQGVKIVQTTKAFETRIGVNTLRDTNNLLKQSDDNSVANTLSSVLERLSNDVASSIPEVDKYAVKLDFIQDIVKNLMRVIGGIIISPKIITILALNHKIIYNETINDPLKFIANNKYFIKMILDGVRDAIIDVLLTKVLKEIEELALRSAVDLATEQIKMTQATMASLVGVPPEITRLISGILKT